METQGEQINDIKLAETTLAGKWNVGTPVAKALIGKTINRTFHVAHKGMTFIEERQVGVTKAEDGSEYAKYEAVEKSVDEDDDSFWGYASVEVEDSAGDIVRIAGIDTDTYHRPPRTHLKILAQHDSSSPTTGEAFIVGRVEEFRRVKTVVNGKIVPALAFRATWAKDGEGNLTPLSKHYKGLKDGGYIDSFSVGMLVKDYEQLDGGGIDYTATLLYETSFVSVPANGYANITSAKAVDDATAVVKTLEATVTSYGDCLAKMAEAVAKLSIQVDDLTKKITEASEAGCQARQGVEGAVTALSTDVTKRLDALDDRFDTLEATTVVKSAAVPTTDDRQVEQVKTVEEIRKTLKRFAGN